MTLTGGNAGSDVGGAIRNTEDLLIRDCVIRNSRALSGGGIANNGFLTVQNSTISGNQAGPLPGTCGEGGGILNTNRLTMRQATVTGNRAFDGGGIKNDFELHLFDSTISDNVASNAEGTAGLGGGISNDGNISEVQNSTISGNAARDQGGGIYQWNQYPFPVVHCTITGNRADSDGSGTGRGGGISAFPRVIIDPLADNSSGLSLRNSLVADNFRGPGTGTEDDIDSVGVFGTNSLVGTGGSSGLVNGQDGNLVGVADPRLGPLTDNGGPTRTHALLTGSPAIDAGTGNRGPNTSDQRGAPFLPVVGAAVDIGAYEAQSLGLVVDTDVDEQDGNFGPGDLSLREALFHTNANPGPDTVAFAPFFNTPDQPRTITLRLGQLAIRDDLQVLAPPAGVVVSGNSASRVMEVGDFRDTAARVVLSGLTITGGNVPRGSGGGILNREDLTVLNGAVRNNSAANGAGIFNERRAS
jgi:hypothetical protein